MGRVGFIRWTGFWVEGDSGLDRVKIGPGFKSCSFKLKSLRFSFELGLRFRGKNCQVCKVVSKGDF